MPIGDAPLIFFAMALRIRFRMTKPLSQNTGMETIQPMSMMASCGCFSPTQRMTTSARRMAPPVFSRIKPMSAPRMMTMPMLANVPEKPAPMMPGIFVSGRPATMARSSETPMSERNGWTLNFEIATIISTIARKKVMRSGMPVMR